MFQSHGGMMCLITGALSPWGPLGGWPTHFKLRSYAYALEWHNAPQFDLGHIIDNGHSTLTMLKPLPKLNALCRLYDPSQTVVRFVKQVCTSS